MTESPPRIYGGLGTLNVLEDGTALYCSDIGDVAEVSSDLVRRLGLTDGARIHARLLVEEADLFGCRGAKLCKILAWHGLQAEVAAMGDDGIELRTTQGPSLRLPAFHATDHALAVGSRLDVVAAPTAEGWEIVAVRRWLD
ncbi:MAG: hypothetical protein HZB16_06640 [Armatimonadetes bacterium]|nr:hypothetical protein [Armatimonadota bacterium]